MVRWLRWHCPPDTGFEIRALSVWGRARYLSVTEAPHNTNFHTWMGKKQFCFFQTAETGNRTPDSGVKGSGANHYPRAPAPWHTSNTCTWSDNTPQKIQTLRSESNECECVLYCVGDLGWQNNPQWQVGLWSTSSITGVGILCNGGRHTITTSAQTWLNIRTTISTMAWHIWNRVLAVQSDTSWRRDDIFWYPPKENTFFC